MEIGFIGLGNLGTPIAENILEKNQRTFCLQPYYIESTITR